MPVSKLNKFLFTKMTLLDKKPFEKHLWITRIRLIEEILQAICLNNSKRVDAFPLKGAQCRGFPKNFWKMIEAAIFYSTLVIGYMLHVFLMGLNISYLVTSQNLTT